MFSVSELRCWSLTGFSSLRRRLYSSSSGVVEFGCKKQACKACFPSNLMMVVVRSGESGPARKNMIIENLHRGNRRHCPASLRITRPPEGFCARSSITNSHGVLLRPTLISLQMQCGTEPELEDQAVAVVTGQDRS